MSAYTPNSANTALTLELMWLRRALFAPTVTVGRESPSPCGTLALARFLAGMGWLSGVREGQFSFEKRAQGLHTQPCCPRSSDRPAAALHAVLPAVLHCQCRPPYGQQCMLLAGWHPPANEFPIHGPAKRGDTTGQLQLASWHTQNAQRSARFVSASTPHVGHPRPAGCPPQLGTQSRHQSINQPIHQQQPG